MDISTVSQLISTLGFPIAVCMICFWYIYKQDENHREQTEKMTDAVNNNTMAIQKLIDKLTE